MNSSYEVYKIAVENDEVIDYLMGRGKYKKIIDKVSDNISPDFSGLLHGVHYLYSISSDVKYVQKFQTALLNMLDGNVEELKAAVIYLGLQLDFEIKRRATFAIDKEYILNYVKTTLYSRKDELENYKLEDNTSMWNFIQDTDEINQITNGHKIL